MKRCLILSYGPVPVPEQDKVEGGGLRCWGLAKGLRANNPSMDITVAYHDGYRKPEATSEYEDIKVTVWNADTLQDLLGGFDTIVVSYCMGELSNKVVECIGTEQQLVLDCYVPIYVEISARQSEDLEGEYAAFKGEVKNWAKVLQRGDVYLCANANQKRYYQGVLSALGRVNPATYADDLILIVPYGVYREPPKPMAKPITALLGDGQEHVKKLLWFGAIYPWFDLRTLVDAVAQVNRTTPLKLVIVGAKNPFNNHPAFVARYNELMDYINESEKRSAHVVIQEWVEFSERADWYLDSDMVILINKIGEENELAWRTRLVDYIWADMPIITNGGDPLGEELIAHDAAIRLGDLSKQGLVEQLQKLAADEQALTTVKKNIRAVRERYYWDAVTEPLEKAIAAHTRPSDIVKFGHIEFVSPDAARPRPIHRRVMGKAKMLPAYYQKYGARNTYHALRTTALNQRNKIPQLRESASPKLVFISHQFDMTGGPIVFLDVLRDFRAKYPRTPFVLHTFNPADSENVAELNKIGIKPKIHLSRDISLEYNKGDVVVLNTLSYTREFLGGLFQALKDGTVKHLVWYIHEDEPQLIFSKSQKTTIKQLLDAGKITIFTPAIKSTENYQEYFQDQARISTQYYRLGLPASLEKIRDEADFNEMDFVLPGMVGDGRKGQLPIFYAFSMFKKTYYDASPKSYRPFTLTLVGLGDDFYSRQILTHAGKSLGPHFRHYGKVNHRKSLEIIKKANCSLCYSLRECLPRVVFEGMVAGHPLLRNDCSGLEEQLQDGKNGYLLDSRDLTQVVTVIERLLNRETTTNKQLVDMSRQSRSIAAGFDNVNYDDFIALAVNHLS